MKSKEFNGTLIITDPCYIADKRLNDWGKDFDYEIYKVRNPIFTDYIWTNTGFGDGTIEVCNFDGNLNRVELEKFVDNISKAYEKFTQNPNIDNKVNLEGYIKQQSYAGRFCVDSGTFGIFYLDEVLKYKPRFLTDYGIWCYTIIHDFVGSIDIYRREHNFNILGIGNKTFFSI